MPSIAYLSLGSNIGGRERNLQRAIESLGLPPTHIVRRSSFYETEPQDVTSQPWFLNAVIEIETNLFPMRLLARIHKIERELGRTRSAPKGPRTIDIDILLYGSSIVDTPKLQIPHPRLAARRFVLEPLYEIAPGLRHPVTGRAVKEMLAATLRQAVRKKV